MRRFSKKENLHFIHLMGGLGNQLFQIAAGLHYGNKFKSILIIDDSFGNFRKNKFGEADLFSYRTNLISTSEEFYKNNSFINKNISLSIRISLKSRKFFIIRIAKILLDLVVSVLLSIRYGRILRVWSVDGLGYQDISNSIYSKYMIGYFQTYRFAVQKEVYLELRNLSVINNSINEYKLLALIEKPLVVHVRLGDYLSEDNFGVLSNEYYDKALSLMISKFNFKHIWVFSDEIEKAKLYIPKQYLKICRWIGDEEDSAAVTLQKMRLGNGYVIANSSLSWWGSFLSNNSGAPTIAPDPWFIGMNDPIDLIPDNWIKISR